MQASLRDALVQKPSLYADIRCKTTYKRSKWHQRWNKEQSALGEELTHEGESERLKKEKNINWFQEPLGIAYIELNINKPGIQVLPYLSYSTITICNGPGMGDGEHILMVPFRGWATPSVVAAAFPPAADKKGRTGLLREQNRGWIHYNLCAAITHFYHLLVLSFAFVQSSNLIPTLGTCSRIHPNF